MYEVLIFYSTGWCIMYNILILTRSFTFKPYLILFKLTLNLAQLISTMHNICKCQNLNFEHNKKKLMWGMIYDTCSILYK